VAVRPDRYQLGYQCCAVFVPRFNEIWFFVTVQGQTNPTLGVIYSIDQQCWAPLYWGRCGGTHFTQGDTRPIMGDGITRLLFQHENTNDADGVALPLSMTLAPYALSKGGRFSYIIEYMVADFFQQVGDITQTLTSYDRMDEDPLETEVDNITATNADTIDSRVFWPLHWCHLVSLFGRVLCSAWPAGRLHQKIGATQLRKLFAMPMPDVPLNIQNVFNEIFRASQDGAIEDLGSAYTITGTFTATRNLNVTTPTAANIAAVLATLISDLQRGGTSRTT